LPYDEKDTLILNPEIQSVHITAEVETMKGTGMKKLLKYIPIKYPKTVTCWFELSKNWPNTLKSKAKME
jgi:hypothetical protein